MTGSHATGEKGSRGARAKIFPEVLPVVRALARVACVASYATGDHALGCVRAWTADRAQNIDWPALPPVGSAQSQSGFFVLERRTTYGLGLVWLMQSCLGLFKNALRDMFDTSSLTRFAVPG